MHGHVRVVFLFKVLPGLRGGWRRGRPFLLARVQAANFPEIINLLSGQERDSRKWLLLLPYVAVVLYWQPKAFERV